MASLESKNSKEINQTKPSLIEKLRGRQRLINGSLAAIGVVAGASGFLLELPPELRLSLVAAATGWTVNHAISAARASRELGLVWPASYFTVMNTFFYSTDHKMQYFDVFLGIGAAGLTNELINKVLKQEAPSQPKPVSIWAQRKN